MCDEMYEETLYFVQWKIEVHASNAREAAKQAFSMMQEPTSACVFDVGVSDGAGGMLEGDVKTIRY